MTSFLHISDPHIGQRGMVAASKTVVNHIIDNNDPCPVALTGDITDHGKTEEYLVAIDVLKPLIHAGFELLPVPGNHDCGWYGVNFQQSARNAFDVFMDELCGLIIPQGAWPYVHDSGHLRIICVDSCIPPVPLARGRVGYLQTLAITRELEAAQRAGKRSVLAMHHYLFPVNATLDLVDADAVLLAASHRCDVAICGHNHTQGEWSDVYGIRRIYSACKTTESMKYRKITVGKKIISEWVYINSPR